MTISTQSVSGNEENGQRSAEDWLGSAALPQEMGGCCKGWGSRPWLEKGTASFWGRPALHAAAPRHGTICESFLLPPSGTCACHGNSPCRDMEVTSFHYMSFLGFPHNQSQEQKPTPKPKKILPKGSKELI